MEEKKLVWFLVRYWCSEARGTLWEKMMHAENWQAAAKAVLDATTICQGQHAILAVTAMSEEAK